MVLRLWKPFRQVIHAFVSCVADAFLCAGPQLDIADEKSVATVCAVCLRLPYVPVASFCISLLPCLCLIAIHSLTRRHVQAAAHVKDKFKGLDILVNNAGTASKGSAFNEEIARTTIGVNYFGMSLLVLRYPCLSLRLTRTQARGGCCHISCR